MPVLGHNFSLRRITSTGRDLPSETRTTIRHFLGDCRELATERASIYNMDEISIDLDAPCIYTVIFL